MKKSQCCCPAICSPRQFKLRDRDLLPTHGTDLILFASPELVTKEGDEDRAAEIDLIRIF